MEVGVNCEIHGFGECIERLLRRLGGVARYARFLKKKARRVRIDMVTS